MTREPQMGGYWCCTCTPGSSASRSALAAWTRRWAISCSARVCGPPLAQRSSTGTGAIAQVPAKTSRRCAPVIGAAGRGTEPHHNAQAPKRMWISAEVPYTAYDIDEEKGTELAQTG